MPRLSATGGACPYDRVCIDGLVLTESGAAFNARVKDAGMAGDL